MFVRNSISSGNLGDQDRIQIVVDKPANYSEEGTLFVRNARWKKSKMNHNLIIGDCWCASLPSPMDTTSNAHFLCTGLFLSGLSTSDGATRLASRTHQVTDSLFKGLDYNLGCYSIRDFMDSVDHRFLGAIDQIVNAVVSQTIEGTRDAVFFGGRLSTIDRSEYEVDRRMYCAVVQSVLSRIRDRVGIDPTCLEPTRDGVSVISDTSRNRLRLFSHCPLQTLEHQAQFLASDADRATRQKANQVNYRRTQSYTHQSPRVIAELV